jgi:hypothetical protein
MARGKTLWEMLMEKLSSPVEFKFYNPLRARIGHAVTIDEVELRDFNFFLREIREYKRHIEGKEFLFADYVLLARPLNHDDVWVRLRLNPVDESERAGGLSHHVLMLKLYDEMAYDEGLHQVLNDTTKRFQVIEEGQVQEEYWRINDVSSPYKAVVAVIRDVNQDNKVEMSEVERVRLEYWDYWRETTDETGVKLTEYLFVEMDTSNGWFQMWKGTEIDPQRVMVI